MFEKKNTLRIVEPASTLPKRVTWPHVCFWRTTEKNINMGLLET